MLTDSQGDELLSCGGFMFEYCLRRGPSCHCLIWSCFDHVVMFSDVVCEMLFSESFCCFPRLAEVCEVVRCREDRWCPVLDIKSVLWGLERHHYEFSALYTRPGRPQQGAMGVITIVLLANGLQYKMIAEMSIEQCHCFCSPTFDIHLTCCPTWSS